MKQLPSVGVVKPFENNYKFVHIALDIFFYSLYFDTFSK